METIHYIFLLGGLLLVAVGLQFLYPKIKERMAVPVEEEEEIEGQSKLMRWLKRIGFAGFMFFLIKGLIWLAIFYFGGKTFN